jgi:hypothetical protein
MVAIPEVISEQELSHSAEEEIVELRQEGSPAKQ